MSISALLEMKAASASPFDLVLLALILMIELQLIVSPMNASSDMISQPNIAPIMLFFELTSSTTYGWRQG